LDGDDQEDQLSVELVAHRPEWAEEFARLAAELRAALGPLALRIDHIGSTSVPGLAAKDVVDLQVIVERLEPVDPIVRAFDRAGYELGAYGEDHVPAGWAGANSEWVKLFFLPGSGRRVHVHVRAAGSPNERYALLFRDYLRAHDDARDRWALVKAEIAAATATRDEYAVQKDPLTDDLMVDAEAWAAASGWKPA
jgi:GrpB-like predicted nucleotidyltransferase (UPF0157 family)